MRVAYRLKKSKTAHKGVKLPTRWTAMTLLEQRAWTLGVDMTLAQVKREAS